MLSDERIEELAMHLRGMGDSCYCDNCRGPLSDYIDAIRTALAEAGKVDNDISHDLARDVFAFMQGRSFAPLVIQKALESSPFYTALYCGHRIMEHDLAAARARVKEMKDRG